MNKEKIGFLAGLDFGKWQPEKVVESLSSLGYKGIEWTLSHFNPRTKSQQELNELVKLTNRSGMEISEVVIQQDLVHLDENVRKDRTELVKECIKTSSEAGIKTINLFTGPAPWNSEAPIIGKNIKEGKAWDMVFKSYDEIVSLAEKYKVELAVEGVWGMLCHDYYTTRLLIDHYDSEYLGVNFDPSHDILYGNLDVSWLIKQWGAKIKHIHLKDAVGTVENFIFPLLGEGLVDWNAFFKTLNDINYQGFCSVEFESFTYYRQILNNDPVEAARISMELIKKLRK